MFLKARLEKLSQDWNIEIINSIKIKCDPGSQNQS